jgi:hypothetical protein
MKVQLSILATAACALLMAIPLSAANTAATKPAKKTAAVRSMWPPENLSGTIAIVDPSLKRVVVQTAGGVPFDMVITRSTRIESGGREITLQDLKQDMNKGVSVKFVPERRGDVARTILLNG